MEQYILKTKQLSVGYDKNVVVSDVNLMVRKGEILSLIGPNGAGKTTALKTIIKQLEPLQGEIFLSDVSVKQILPRELAKRMAVVLTEPLHTELMSVYDVVCTGRYPYTGYFGTLSEEDEEIVEAVMQETGIAPWKNQDFSKLSDGQKQRVLLARAFAQQPEILILDEPTSYLDMKHKVEFLSVLKRMAQEQKLTVILSIHEVELARIVSDQIACFKKGKLDAYGTPQEVFVDDYILRLYDVDMSAVNPAFYPYFETMKFK